jgi:hypothetical protein
MASTSIQGHSSLQSAGFVVHGRWPFKLFGVRIIYDVHDLWPEMFEAKFGKRGLSYLAVRLAQRLTYACADVVLATNETNQNVAIDIGKKSPQKVFIVRTAPKIPEIGLRRSRL